MSKLILLRGLPASGKSTRAKELLESMGNAVRLNKDLLRTMLHLDKFTFINEGLTRDATLSLARSYLSNNINVIVDDTNLNPKTVESWKTISKECKARFEIIDTDTDVITCLYRDMQRENKVGEHVIKKMALQYKDYLKGEKVVVCDLDGTICDISHRLHFVKVPEGKTKDWKSFFNQIPFDILREDVSHMLRKELYDQGAKLVFVSARPEDYRKDTEEWLQSELFDYSVLIMREKGDKRPDTEVKSDIYEKYLKNLDIIKVFDDRPSVIRMWREKGLEVIDVGKGEEF